MLFIENTFTGIGILAAVTAFSPYGGLAILSGSALAQFWANVLNLDKGLTRSGLYAFNSVLVVAALNVFVLQPAAVIPLSIIGSLASVVLFDRGAKIFSFPLISIPFIIVMDSLLLAARSLSIPTVSFSMPPPINLLPFNDFVTSLSTIPPTVPLTFSQLFFSFSPFIGAGIIAAAAIGDRKTIFSGVCGAAIGSSIGMLLGFDVSNGLWGFNSALTAMGLYPTFGLPFLGAMAGAGVTALVQPLAMQMFGFFGLPSLSFSFCLTCLMVLRLYQRATK